MAGPVDATLIHGVLLWLRISAALWSGWALLAERAAVFMPLWLTLPLALCAWPLSAQLPATAAATLPALLQAALGELLFGLWLAFVLVAPLLAVRWAGELVELLWRDGWADANTAADGLSGRFFAALAVALFAALGGLRVAAQVLFGSLIRYPVGSLPAKLGDGALWTLVQLLGDALQWALLMAGPSLLAYLFATLGVGMLARVAGPYGGALLATLPLRALLLIALLLLTLAGLAEALPEHVAAALRALERAHPAF